MSAVASSTWFPILAAVLLIALWLKLRWLSDALVMHGVPFREVRRSASVAIILLLAAPLWLLSPGPRWLSVLTVNLALTSLALADTWYYRYYGDVLSVAALADAPQLRRVLPSFSGLVRSRDFLMFLDVAIGLLLHPWVQAHAVEALVWQWSVAASLLVLGIIAAIPALRLFATDPDELFEYVFQRRQIVTAIGLVPYHVYDLLFHLRYLLAGRMRVSSAEFRTLEQVVSERQAERGEPALFAAARGLNLLMVSAESLQGFVLGLEIEGRPVAPHVTAFARESLRFTRFHDQTHFGTTADAEWLTLQSLYPLARGAVATRFISNEFRGLPGILAEHGYATMSACAEPADFWNMRQMHPRLGFERSMFGPDYAQGEWVGIGLADDEFFEQTVTRLAAIGQPFFSYLITSSVHWPFNLPESHRHFDPGRFRGSLVGDYLQSLHYFDLAFARLLAALRKTGLLDRTLLVMFGDHQAHISNEPHAAELPGVSTGGAARSLDAHTRWRLAHDVPLLMRFPEGRFAGVCDTPGGHIDVAPTLLALAGISGEGRGMLGSDLTAPRERPLIFRDGSVVDGNTMFLAGENRCYGDAGGEIACDTAHYAAVARRELEVSDAMVRGNLVKRLAAPRPPQPRPSPPARILIVAHRGDSRHFPENTVPAIRSGFALGADIVEVDVRLSLDRVPVLIHNDSLEETTDGTGLVAEKTLAELTALDAGSWKDPRFARERIAALEEALEVSRGCGRLLIDVNAEGLAALVARAYRRLDIPEAEAVIGAWNADQIKEFAREMPGALILHSSGIPDHEDFRGFQAIGARGFEVGEFWPPRFVDAARSAGMIVIAYTINDEGTMRRLIRMGVDGIETDDPGLLAAIRNEAVRSPDRDRRPREMPATR